MGRMLGKMLGGEEHQEQETGQSQGTWGRSLHRYDGCSLGQKAECFDVCTIGVVGNHGGEDKHHNVDDNTDGHQGAEDGPCHE